MFDDFVYQDVNDTALNFNKWKIVEGINGPPSGAMYRSENVFFTNSEVNPTDKYVNLSTTVANGNTTHARIQTNGFEYFEGTYAARVYYTDNPFIYEDANIQTFYTIVDWTLSGDGSKYSELDFEYMASDRWGLSEKNEVMYLTAWNRYIAEPWQAWKRYWYEVKSYEGWHTFVVSCTDGVNVNFYMNGEFITSMSTTDNDGTSVYPRSPMQVAFANWIWNNVVGTSTQDRTSTMKADWVYYIDQIAYNPAQVDSVVRAKKSAGIIRENLEGGVRYSTTQLPYNNLATNIPGTIYAEKYDFGGQGISFYENSNDGVNQAGSDFRLDGVDVGELNLGDYNVGYIETGEWLEYTVNVVNEGNYDIAAFVGNGVNTEVKFLFEIDGLLIGDTAKTLTTGGWTNWGEVSMGSVFFTEGIKTLRFKLIQGGLNLDEIIFTESVVTSVNDVVETTFFVSPLSDGFILQNVGKKSSESFQVTVYNLSGQLVASTNYFDAQNIEVRGLENGAFFIEIATQGFREQHKIVIH